MPNPTRQLFVRWQVFLEGARKHGLLRTLFRRVAGDIVSATAWTALLPLTILLHIAGFRRLTVITGRIGHLAAEMDCFAKARRLGELPSRRWLLLAPPGRVANTHLLEYWKQEVIVVSHPVVCFVLETMSRWWLMRYDVSHYILRLHGTHDLYRINAAGKERASVLQLTPEDEAWTTRSFTGLGIPAGGWYVCIHVREPGFSPTDDPAHAHRNGDPRAALPAMREIVRRGGWCVRMGDPSMSPLPQMDQVIDYARHPLRSERLDVVLCARARFLLGNTSGLFLVSTAFGVPCALANMIPMSVLAPCRRDISVPKLLYHQREQRMLRFGEVLGSPLGNYRYAKLYADDGIVPVENTPDEILELVREMLDRLEGRFEETDEDRKLQERFMKLLQPGHYSYGAASRMGAAFLRKYRHLLEH